LAKNLFLPKKSSISLSAQLAFIAGLSGLIYLLVFTLPFPLPRLYTTIPPVDYTKLTGYSVNGFITYIAGLGTLFGLYIWAILLTLPEEAGEHPRELPGAGGLTIQNNAGLRASVSGWFVGAGSTIFAVILIFSYPLTAIDLFIYAIRTRGWALYGLNPLATPPEALPVTDPWLGLAAEWVDAPSPYGPLWEWLSLGVFYLSGGAFLNHLFGLKIIAALAFLGCAWLIYQILRQLQPEWAVAGVISFAWCPLALLESVQNGHNDIVMTFFLLAAVWATNGVIRHSLIRYSLIFLFLALSILVKFVTILIVPFFLLAITAQAATWIKRLALIIAYGMAIGVLVILPMLPMWPGWDNWAVLQAGSGAGRSLLALLILGFKDAWGVNFAFDFWRNLLFLIYALIYCYYLWQMFNSNQKSVASSQRVTGSPPSPHPSILPILPPPTLPILQSSFHVLFWYVLLVAPVFHAWYLLWFLPLAALQLPDQRPLVASIVFSITALFIIPYFETIRVWYPALLDNQLLGHLIGVPLLIVPPALALLWPIRPKAKSEV
jgi:hypothetical protein